MPSNFFRQLSFRLFGLPSMVLVAQCRTEKRYRDIYTALENIMDILDDLLGAVQAQRTKIDSLIALTSGLHDKVKAELANVEGITPSQKMRIDAIFKAVEENSDAVDAAITANTDEQVSNTVTGAVSGGPSFSDIKSDLSGAGGAPVPTEEAPQPPVGDPPAPLLQQEPAPMGAEPQEGDKSASA